MTGNDPIRSSLAAAGHAGLRMLVAGVVALGALSSVRGMEGAPAVAGASRATSVNEAVAAPARPRVDMIELDGSALPGAIVAVGGAEPTVWFAAPQRSAIGEVDVASRALGYISLGHGAKPRALVACGADTLFAADAALNVVHEITPSSEDVKRHTMPDGRQLELTSVACAGPDAVLFAGYQGFVGKIDRRTGEVRVVEAAGGRGPTALVTAANGTVWLASYASNVIVRIDPLTLKQDQVAMPAGVLGPKSIAVDAGGRVWVAAFRSGRVLRYDPRRRVWDGWALEPGSKPYALAFDASGAVLVSDTGRDRLVRLDPTAGAQSTIAHLSERGQARNMVALGPMLWIAETAVDRLTIIDTSAPSQ